MSLMIIYFFMIILLMLLMNILISKKSYKLFEKSSSFECGFDLISSHRLPFSLQFYLIAVIFLIFDVEISLIIPMITSNKYWIYELTSIMIMIFIILLFGLYLEWNEGALKWFN